MIPHTLEENRQDTKSRILAEAERLFRHYGYAKTTVADIARELGMSPANVYRFFPSKAAINEAICGQMLDDRIALSLKLSHQPISAMERLRAILLATHRKTADVLIGDKKVHEIVAVAMTEQWEAIRDHLRRQVEILASVVAEGMATGEIAEGDPLNTAKCLHQGFCSMIHPQVLVQCMDDDDKAGPEELVDYLLKALRP
jgi:AcrR family transcriptional regulator